MWIAKGIAVGLAVFAGFTILRFKIYFFPDDLKQGTAIGLNAVSALTVKEPLYWFALVLVIEAACVCGRMMQAP